jgi:hypothetical protein
LLAALPGQVTTAVQNRETEKADAALASATQELDSGLTTVQTALTGATEQLPQLEAKAKEMAGFNKALSSGFELHGALDGAESQLIAFHRGHLEADRQEHLVHVRSRRVRGRRLG